MLRRFSVLRRLILLVAIVGSSSVASAAAIVADNWTLDFGGVTGPSNDLIVGIDRLGFNADINHLEVTKGNNPGTGLPNTGTMVEPGDTARFRGLIRVDTFLDEDGLFTGTGGPIFTPLLNAPAAMPGAWELTAKFQTNILFVETSSPFVGFVHLGGGDSFLNLYLDEYGNGANGAKSSPLSGLGYDDGDLIAEFIDVYTGEVNPFSPSSLDGSDDARFKFVQGQPGVVFDAAGNDLLDPDLLDSILTDQNFDTFNPLGILPSMFGSPGGPFPGAVVATPTTDLNFFAFGDGSAILLATPEPGSLAMCGLGLGAIVTFAWRYRRQMRSAPRQQPTSNPMV